ncbi:MAG: SMP-30/gluconolactonase/LRE family protein [Burkholderiales bacterium]
MYSINRIGTQSDVLGEGPTWCVREQALYWVSIREPAVRRFTPASGKVDTWSMPEAVGSLAIRREGGLLVALRSSLSLFDPASGKLTALASPEAHIEHHRFNDGKCDRQGRFWAGTMHDITRDPVGSLYRLDAQGRCDALQSGIRIPNSLAWSTDGRTMYFADSPLRTIFAYDFDADTGQPSNKREFVRVENPGIPDGAAIDEEDHLWVAIYDGWKLHRYTPKGTLRDVVELPVQRPTMMAFGGADMRTLFITTASQKLTSEELEKQPLAGALLCTQVSVRGVPDACFAG